MAQHLYSNINKTELSKKRYSNITYANVLAEHIALARSFDISSQGLNQAINLKALSWGSIECTYQTHCSAKDFWHIFRKSIQAINLKALSRGSIKCTFQTHCSAKDFWHIPSGQRAQLKVLLPSIADGRGHMLTGQKTSHD